MRATLETLSAPVVCLAFAASCSGGGGGGGSPADVSGAIAFVADGTTLPVIEPNDSVDAPQSIVELRAGRRIELRDTVDPATDPLDGFRLRAREPLLVQARLVCLDPAASRPDLMIYDPIAMRPRESADAGEARFVVHGACDVVVRAGFDPAHAGPARYVLQISTQRAVRHGTDEDAAGRPASGSVARTHVDSRESVPALALESAPAESAIYGRPKLSAARGQLLIKRKPGRGGASVLASRGLRVRDAIPGDAELVAFDVAPSASDEDTARLAVALTESLLSGTEFEYVERNLVRHALGVPVVPNDTHFPLQWHYPLAHIPEAWAVTTGDDAIIVAVIDTGETAHPDLAGRQIAGYDFISDAANAGDGDGRDADPADVGDGNGLQPSSFHGTHVAGTIGAATDNASGVAGITWSGKIMHLRVLGFDGGTDFDIANAIRYAARLSNASSTLPPAQANVINLSLGSPGASSTVQSAVNAARAQNVVVFAAAGNENTGQPNYPAASAGVISVAAVGPNAERAPYSNFGATIDIAAPGGDTSADLDGDGYADGVLSTLMDDSGAMLTPIFAFYQGTSMACPHAAGVAALMLALDPTLTPDDVETILESTATDLGSAGRDDLYGAGLIHARRAVDRAAGTPPSGAPVLSLAPESLAFGTVTTGLFSAVSNGGSGLLMVTSATTQTDDGGLWLSTSVVPDQTPTSSDTEMIVVGVNRAGLPDGDYSGTVTVDSNGGTKVLQISMSVAAATTPVDVDLFVLAVDFDTFETVAQVVVNPTTGLDYMFSELPPGDYLIAAGSDDDGDDVICGDGDIYCGLYPSVNEPEVVSVSGTALVDVDFPVTPAESQGPILGRDRSMHIFRIVRR